MVPAPDSLLMRHPPNPYRVLAHAIDAGDVRLAELLSARLRPLRVRPAGPDRAIERLMRVLGLV